MLNILCPTRNEINDIDSILEEKNDTDKKKVLKKLRQKIKQRYSDYATIELNNRIKSVRYSETEKDALQSLYNSKTSTAKQICDSILRAQIAKQAGCCLSCGIGEVDQIDHFLPQEHFPEFSILHKNLTPICGLCNEVKGNHIPGDGKDFIHPMFDQIPNEPVLSCKIDYISNIPIAYFSMLIIYKNHRIQNHFDDLKLEKRLQDKATQYFLQLLAYKTEFGDEFATTEIERDVQKIGVCFGTNFWKYLLCEKMLRTDFIKNIKST